MSEVREPQQELMGALRSQIESGIIRVVEDKATVNRLNSLFAFGETWENAPTTSFAQVDVADVANHETIAALVQILRHFASDAKITDLDEVILIGDGMMDLAFWLPLAVLLDNLHHFWAYAQDIYVCDQHCAWCFVSKMVGTNYWGPGRKVIS